MAEQQPWIDAPPPPPELSKARRRAWIGLGLATTPMLFWGACTARLLDVSGDTTGILMLVALGLSVVGAGFGVDELLDVELPPARLRLHRDLFRGHPRDPRLAPRRRTTASAPHASAGLINR